MSSAIRPYYADDALTLFRDTTSSFTAAGLTATNYVFCGADSWTIAIPQSLTSTTALTIQGNNSNPLEQISSSTTSTTNFYYSQNPLLNQPSMAKKIRRSYNNSFTANWVDIATINAGVSLRSLDNLPVRYIRIKGDGLTGAGWLAHVWTASMTEVA